MPIPSTIIDEGVSSSILSATTLQDLSSLRLAPITHNLLAFNKRTSQALGILHNFPINLGGKFTYLDVKVVQGPFDFNLLFDHDYFYVMGALVFSLFRVICFLREVRILAIDKLSFIGPNLTPNQSYSLNGPCMKVGSLPP